MTRDAGIESFIAEAKRGVFATLRASGHPQMSIVMFEFVDGVISMSVTDGRAKTNNVRRDGRAAMHVSTPDLWQWAVAQGTAEVGEVSREPGDAAGQDLLALYNRLSDTPHPDEAEFLQAMADEGRCIVRLHVDHVYGQIQS